MRLVTVLMLSLLSAVQADLLPPETHTVRQRGMLECMPESWTFVLVRSSPASLRSNRSVRCRIMGNGVDFAPVAPGTRLALYAVRRQLTETPTLAWLKEQGALCWDDQSVLPRNRVVQEPGWPVNEQVTLRVQILDDGDEPQLRVEASVARMRDEMAMRPGPAVRLPAESQHELSNVLMPAIAVLLLGTLALLALRLRARRTTPTGPLPS